MSKINSKSVQQNHAQISATANNFYKYVQERDLEYRGQESYPIYVRLLDAVTVVLKVYSSDCIAMIKYIIKDNEGIPIDQQRLTYAGKRLDDERTLSNYNIKSDLHFILF
jgi:large subunit ribosomal protein L40e